MTSCANCNSDATYKVNHDGGPTQNFCARHLPLFINLRKHLGNLVEEIKTEVKEEVKKIVPTPPKKKKEEPVIEAPVAEAPVAEEPVEQAE